MAKKVLLLVGSRPSNPDGYNWEGLREWLERLLPRETAVSIAALTELVYIADTDSAIFDPVQNFDLADFDMVVFRTVGKQLDLGNAAAHYLHTKGIKFVDNYLLAPSKSKLASSFLRLSHGLPVPRTIYAAPEILQKVLKEQALLVVPFVLKADAGKKGNNNFLVHTFDELKTVLEQVEDVAMIAQPFIQNEGDYRVLVLGNKARLAFLRKGDGTSHLNNTSKGGSASLVAVDSLPVHIVSESEKAAELEGLEVAGVDVIIDKHTGAHYFLEVNRAPQIPTGAFAHNKMEKYAEMIAEYLQEPLA